MHMHDTINHIPYIVVKRLDTKRVVEGERYKIEREKEKERERERGRVS